MIWSSEQHRAQGLLRIGESPRRTAVGLVALVGGSVWLAVANMQHLSSARQIVVAAVAAAIALALVGITLARLRQLTPQSIDTRRANARRAQLLAAPCAGVALIVVSTSGHFALALAGAIGAGFFLGGAPMLLIAAARSPRAGETGAPLAHG